jgi:hypothetical protein
MSAALGKAGEGRPSGMSGHRLARVDLHGEWRILVVTNMADDETGAPGIEPHVQPMLLAGRALSGFICIEPEGYAADDALASWVQRGLDFVSGLPAKPVRVSS